MTNKNAYAQSGVDVEAGYEVVERIKKHVARTERAGVMGALGGFGGMFDLSSMTNTIPSVKTVWPCVSTISSLQEQSLFTSWTISQLVKMNQLN